MRELKGTSEEPLGSGFGTIMDSLNVSGIREILAVVQAPY